MAVLTSRSGAPLVRATRILPTRYFIAHGDSITFGVGVDPTQAFPYLVAQAIQSNFGTVTADVNKGINGQGFHYVYPLSGNPNNLIDDYPINIRPLILEGVDTDLCIFAATNDLWQNLGNRTAAQTLTDFETYIQLPIADGLDPERILVPLVLPREGGFTGSRRADYNSGVVALQSTYGFTLVRTDLDSRIGDEGDQNDTNYYQTNKIHPNAAGHQVIADLIYAAMFP